MTILKKIRVQDIFYLGLLALAFVLGKSCQKPKLPSIPETVTIIDTVLIVKPADTSKPKIIERVIYAPVTPVSVHLNVGGVDSFLLENPRGITEVIKRGRYLTVSGYFRDTAVSYHYPLRHENFRVRLSYNKFLVDQPRLKVDKFIGVRVLYPDYSIGVYGGLLFNDRFGINIEANTKGVGFGILYFFK